MNYVNPSKSAQECVLTAIFFGQFLGQLLLDAQILDFLFVGLQAQGDVHFAGEEGQNAVSCWLGL